MQRSTRFVSHSDSRHSLHLHSVRIFQKIICVSAHITPAVSAFAKKILRLFWVQVCIHMAVRLPVSTPKNFWCITSACSRKESQVCRLHECRQTQRRRDARRVYEAQAGHANGQDKHAPVFFWHCSLYKHFISTEVILPRPSKSKHRALGTVSL